MHIKWCDAWDSIWLPLLICLRISHHSQLWSSFPALLDFSELFKFTLLILPSGFINTVLCLKHFSVLFWLPSTQTSRYSLYLTSSGILSVKFLLCTLNFSNLIPYYTILRPTLQYLDLLLDKSLCEGAGSVCGVHHYTTTHSCCAWHLLSPS